MASSLPVVKFRDGRVISKPTDLKKYRNKFCIKMCENIMGLKEHNLFTSIVIGIEDRFDSVALYKYSNGEIFGKYKLHNTQPEQFEHNILWPVFHSDGIIVHFEGEVRMRVKFKYGTSFNEMCSFIVCILCKSTVPANEPQLERDLNEDDDIIPDSGSSTLLSDDDSDIDFGADEFFTFQSGVNTWLTNIECRLDTILSKMPIFHT